MSALAEPAALEPGPRTRRISSPGAVLAVAALGTFMAFVDATIVNIAIPDIHQEFTGSSLSSVSWVLNAYNIVFAAFLVGGGQLADLLGRRRIFGLALVLFTLASARVRRGTDTGGAGCCAPGAGGGSGGARAELARHRPRGAPEAPDARTRSPSGRRSPPWRQASAPRWAGC